MANTYSQLYVHIIFAVKYRQNLLKSQWRNELHKYMCGVANGKNYKVLAIGGVADHVHLLFSLKPNVLISDVVRDIKANSSRWINEHGLVLGKFQWQEGFGAFSVGHSQVHQVIDYINNQEEHHYQHSFREEYMQLLGEFEIDYDEQYVFDWVDN